MNRPLIRLSRVEELPIIRATAQSGWHGEGRRGQVQEAAVIGYRGLQSILGGRRMGPRVPGTSSVAVGQTRPLLT